MATMGYESLPNKEAERHKGLHFFKRLLYCHVQVICNMIYFLCYSIYSQEKSFKIYFINAVWRELQLIEEVIKFR